jgi:hypothetical protein
MKHKLDYKLPQEEFKKELEQMLRNGATMEELFDEAFTYVYLHDLLVGDYDPYDVWIDGQTYYHFDLNEPKPSTEDLLKEIYNEVQNGIWETARRFYLGNETNIFTPRKIAFKIR